MSAVLAAIFPVFLVAGAGYGLRRALKLDLRTLSSLNIYLFIPCLVFSNLSRNLIAWHDFGRIALATGAMAVSMSLILGAVARLRGLKGASQSAFLMTMFMNLGNFGLPVCKFAFGDEGLALAVVVMVCGSFLQNSVGLYFAQRSRHSAVKSLVRVFYFPMVYAFALALVFQRMDWYLPTAVSRAIDIAADAAIPAQLLVLGIQLAETRLDTGSDVFLAAGIRLCVGPPVALLLALLVGIGGMTARVFILQMSGPVAVGMAVYGVQFDVKPRFLASVVSWTFLLSVVSVSCTLFALIRAPL